MAEKTIEIELSILLPEVEGLDDACLVCLVDMLRERRGIIHVHLEQDADPPCICIHFDPNLIGLEAVRWAAKKCGCSSYQPLPPRAHSLQRDGHRS